VDPQVNFGGSVLLRATDTVPAQSRITLASLWITKGGNPIAFTGGLVLVPPTPTISNVQDAESARTSIVPGEWTAIYGANLAPKSVRIWQVRILSMATCYRLILTGLPPPSTERPERYFSPPTVK
jgi:hypothetical protein